MRFLGRGGYPFELEEALATFEVGGVYTVVDCDVQDWSHSIRFEEHEGRFNGVMFEWLPAADSPTTPPTSNRDLCAGGLMKEQG